MWLFLHDDLPWLCFLDDLWRIQIEGAILGRCSESLDVLNVAALAYIRVAANRVRDQAQGMARHGTGAVNGEVWPVGFGFVESAVWHMSELDTPKHKIFRSDISICV